MTDWQLSVVKNRQFQVKSGKNCRFWGVSAKMRAGWVKRCRFWRKSGFWVKAGRAGSPLPAAYPMVVIVKDRRARSDAPYQIRIPNAAGATGRTPHSALSIPHLNGSFPEFSLGWTIGGSAPATGAVSSALAGNTGDVFDEGVEHNSRGRLCSPFPNSAGQRGAGLAL